jgi:HTH-type transcriptional regulator, sugar sensing transcriptional regulator
MEFDKKIKVVLLEIGLSSIQSDFYLAVLKNGPAPVSKIAKTLNINRTNSYVVVERLKELDLVWEENKPQGKVLHAKSYTSVITALKKKEEELVAFKETVTSFAPIFDSFTLTQNTSGPKIKLFQSKSGLSSLVDEIITSSNKTKEILLFTNQDTEKGFFTKKTHDEFIKRRIDNTIGIKVLAVNNDAGQQLHKLDAKYLRKTKMLPDSFQFNSEIYIYDNKISMIDIKEEIIGVVIESEELYKIHRQMFEVLWVTIPD